MKNEVLLYEIDLKWYVTKLPIPNKNSKETNLLYVALPFVTLNPLFEIRKYQSNVP